MKMDRRTMLRTAASGIAAICVGNGIASERKGVPILKVHKHEHLTEVTRDMLDGIVKNFKPVPVTRVAYGASTTWAGENIGEVLSVWRDGDYLMADLSVSVGKIKLSSEVWPVAGSTAKYPDLPRLGRVAILASDDEPTWE